MKFVVKLDLKACDWLFGQILSNYTNIGPSSNMYDTNGARSISYSATFQCLKDLPPPTHIMNSYQYHIIANVITPIPI